MTKELALEVIKEIKAQHKLHMETIKDVVFSLDGDVKIIDQYNEYEAFGGDQVSDLVGTIRGVYNV
jgi:hypothetical protein